MKAHSLITLLTLGSSLTALAQTVDETSHPGEPPVKLEDYIVETNSSTFRLKAPAVTHQMVREDLEALNLPETGDALQYLPDLFIRKRFVGDKNALTSIRGTSNRQPGRTLVLADGMVLSNFLGTGFGNSPRWFLIAPEEIEKIAVVYGPYSALYGGNSIGGTVLFTTSAPTGFHASAKGQYMVEDFSEYGTHDTFTGKTGFVSVGNKHGNFSYFAFYNHLDNNSQPMTFNTVNVSATDTAAVKNKGAATTGSLTDTDFSGNARIIYGSQGPTEAIHDLFKVKLGYDLGHDLHLRYSAAYWTNSEDNLSPETYLRDANGTPVFAGTVKMSGHDYKIADNAFTVSRRKQSDFIQAVTVAHEPEEGLQLLVTASAYDVLKDKAYASTSALPAANTGGAGQATLVGDTGWQSVDTIVGWKDKTGVLDGHSVQAGYHFDHYFTEQAAWNMTNWTNPNALTSLKLGNGGRTKIHALFAQDTWSLTKTWSLVPGVRWETWKASDGYQAKDVSGNRVRGNYASRTEAAVSPKGAIAWKPNKDTQVRLSLARAVRFPTVGELFQGSVSSNGSITGNNENLSPEKAFSKDLTVEHRLQGANLRLSLFEEDVKQALVNQSVLLSDGTSFTGVYNVDQVRTRGVEAVYEKKGFLHPSLDFSANVSYANAVIEKNAPILVSGKLVDTSGNQFPRIPHWQFKTITTWHATAKLSVNLGTRYSSHQYNTLDNSDPFGGYGGVDAFFVVDTKVTYRLPHGLTASLGVDNVTDDRYHVFHPMPARTWMAELTWRL